MKSFLPCCASLALLLSAEAACSIDPVGPIELDDESTTPSDPPRQRTNELELRRINMSNGAFSDGTKLEIFAALLAGSEEFLRLGGDDQLTIRVDGNVVPFTERVDGRRVHHIAVVSPVPPQPSVTITLGRGQEEKAMRVDLAPGFALKDPPANVRTGDVVPLAIEPPHDPESFAFAAVEVSGECLQTRRQHVVLCFAEQCREPNALLWDVGQLQLRGAPASCELDVQLRLETIGVTLPDEKPMFGAFEGVQYRSWKTILEP